MLKRFAYIVCFSVLTFLSPNASAQQDYSRLIAFGDSLSDTGNIANATIDFPFPYFQNRISDGLVALDYLAAEIGSAAMASQHLNGPLDGYNYAVAGGNILGGDVEDLTAQVSAYLDRVNNLADQNALFAVVMGGNDIRGIRSISSESIANAEIDLILDTLFEQLVRLQNAGARTIMVSNVPNVGRIPETLQREVEDPGVSARVAGYTQTYNERFALRLQELSNQSNATIVSFDLYAILENIIANAAQLGFTQTEVGCFTLEPFGFHPDCFLGLFFDRFIFFDNLHPTNATHQLVAQGMIASLDTPLIPVVPIDPVDRTFIPIGAIMLLLQD